MDEKAQQFYSEWDKVHDHLMAAGDEWGMEPEARNDFVAEMEKLAWGWWKGTRAVLEQSCPETD